MAEKKQNTKTKKKSKGLYTLYEVKGNSLSKPKSCPKCGVGTFMAIHKNRVSCGKCKYTEFLKK
jgi:ubiquitin-small subunit ribosomal protein S27Ae